MDSSSSNAHTILQKRAKQVSVFAPISKDHCVLNNTQCMPNNIDDDISNWKFTAVTLNNLTKSKTLKRHLLRKPDAGKCENTKSTVFCCVDLCILAPYNLKVVEELGKMFIFSSCTTESLVTHPIVPSPLGLPGLFALIDHIWCASPLFREGRFSNYQISQVDFILDGDTLLQDSTLQCHLK